MLTTLGHIQEYVQIKSYQRRTPAEEYIQIKYLPGFIDCKPIWKLAIDADPTQKEKCM